MRNKTRIGVYAPELLGAALLLVFFCGLAASLFVMLVTIDEGHLSKRSLCYTSECLKVAARIHEYSINIMSTTFAVVMCIATAGGIIVALLSYRESVRANTLSNHIGHLALFQSFVDRESTKLLRVSARSIDVHQWYILMFPESRSGRTSLSSEYKEAVGEIAREIIVSNTAATSAIDGSFRFVEHQERMIRAMRMIGVNITRHSRVEFFEVEIDIFTLINSVNSSFCYAADVAKLPARKYR